MMFLFSDLWRRWVLPLSILTILSACATPKPTAPDIDGLFQRSGRFSVTVNDFSGVKDAVQGGFVWQDDGSSLVLDLANPLGSTLARITVEDGMAVLTHSNGSQEYARDADGLAEIALGNPVPVSGLRHWLRGMTGDTPVQDLETNSEGMPTNFAQDGWHV